MRTRIAVLAAALAAACPAAADAATVSVATDVGEDGERFSSLVVEAGPGEANRLAVASSGRTYSVTDAGAPLTAGAGCSVAAPGRVDCTVPASGGPVSVGVTAGDLDDEVSFAGLAGGGGASGGPGADVLRGGPGADSLNGGSGRDTLEGADGADQLSGETAFTAPDDPGPPEDDSLDGGAGADAVSFADRARPVVVDLAAGAGGEQGERDALVSIETAIGGTGRNTLLGDDGPNGLFGGSQDLVRGRGGDDDLLGGRVFGDAGDDLVAGVATASGGAGDDRVRGRRVRCGSGRDVYGGRALGSPPRTGIVYSSVPRDCELVAVGDFAVSRTPRRVRGGIAFRVEGCAGSRRPCALSARVRAGRTTLGTGRTRLRPAPDAGPPSRATLRVPLAGARGVSRASVRFLPGALFESVTFPIRLR